MHIDCVVTLQYHSRCWIHKRHILRMIDCDVNWIFFFARFALLQIYRKRQVSNDITRSEFLAVLLEKSEVDKRLVPLKSEQNQTKMYIENLDSMSSLMSIKRHYKKDSRYVNDLYTLTYDNCESLNTISLISSIHMINTDDIDDDDSHNVSLIRYKVPVWMCVLLVERSWMPFFSVQLFSYKITLYFAIKINGITIMWLIHSAYTLAVNKMFP